MSSLPEGAWLHMSQKVLGLVRSTLTGKLLSTVGGQTCRQCEGMPCLPTEERSTHKVYGKTQSLPLPKDTWRSLILISIQVCHSLQEDMMPVWS